MVDPKPDYTPFIGGFALLLGVILSGVARSDWLQSAIRSWTMPNKRRGVDDTDGGGTPARKRSAVGTGYDAEFKGFINVDLSSDQKERFADWSDGGGLAEYLPAAVADGVNVTLKLDPKGNGFMASGTQRRVDSPNAGLVVTARARYAILALERLVFILAYLDSGGDWEATQPRADPDRW